MPGALMERNILNNFAVAADQTMRRHPQMRDIREVRMRTGVQRSGEQRVNPWPAKLARRQTDIVYDQKSRLFIIRSAILMRRAFMPDPL